MEQESLSSTDNLPEPDGEQSQLSDAEILQLVEQERGVPRESRVPLIAFCGALMSCVIILPAAFARLRPATGLPIVASAPAPADAPQTPRWVNWTYSLEEAQMQAQRNNQKIFIDFYTDWCPSCKWMDSYVYTRSEVLAESPNFVMVKINAEGRRDLAKRYNIHVYPSLVWTDASGNELGRNDGSLIVADLAARMKQYR